ncbi:MFS transporter [Streptomyces sp. 3MP-14]|uniref:MFS transporter n=1 Tax=Streptomyces mimosae TaxID=2586635 RepID=A0A5N6A2J5_9ACTN|nr:MULTISPECIES: MFS transporter [Streptomyces]KAB8162635.1 MFS transporter [Streptomyces mimosae]KAB8174462.1 MFS transporter [Streptomyces sp. 3MP-14]
MSLPDPPGEPRPGPPGEPQPAPSVAPLIVEAARVRRARVSVGAVFALHGAASGSFVTRIPWLQDQLGLSTAALGLALAFPAVGASVAMPLASRVIHRHGARAAVRGLLALWIAASALPVMAPNMPALCALLFLFGATAGMADVAMNAQGVEVEERHGRSIMSGLHGLWSVGTLTGSALGVGAVALEWDARGHLPLVAALLLLAVVPACRGLLDVRPSGDEAAPPRFALPPRSALLIGAVGICAVLAEGGSMDWSGVYLRDLTGASETVAAASYTAFATTMAVARLVGDAVVRRLGPVRTVRCGGGLAALGGLLVVTAAVPAQGIAGFALIGVGIAVVVPLTFAAAGHSGPNPSRAIAGVATITYTASLIAPTLIGAVGELASLRASFAVVTVATALLVVGAGVLGRGSRPSAPVASAPGAGERAGDRAAGRAE